MTITESWPVPAEVPIAPTSYLVRASGDPAPWTSLPVTRWGADGAWPPPPAWVREVIGRLVADDFAGARDVLADMRAIAEHRGSERDAALVEQFTLRAALYEGRLEEAREAAEQAVATALWRGEEGAGTAATAHAVLAVVDAEQGALEEAGRHLRMARRLGVFAEGMPVADLLMRADAAVQAAAGLPELALRAWMPLFDDPSAWADAVALYPAMVVAACAAAVAAGRPALAERVLASAEWSAAAHDLAPSLVAVVAHVRGTREEQAPAEPGLAALAASPRRLLAAVVHEDAAQALERARQRGPAVAMAKKALTLYAECGATTALQRVRQWLRVRGVSLIPHQRRGRPSFGWDALSEAEGRVVRLVAEGLTNRQIGERLYVSRFTVDTHIRHVFTKLGLSSRVALTRTYLDHLAENA
ncbi:MAG: response regulator transcription factor [Acidimicrobiales bacterium]|nr:response regulator transcription factor [Acidimicrobiales bacterium]